MKFEMKQGELNRRIEAYKTALAAGEFARASWPHLAAWLDTTEEALSQVLRDGPDTLVALHALLWLFALLLCVH